MKIMSCDVCGTRSERSECREIRSPIEARSHFSLDDGRLGCYYLCSSCFHKAPRPSDEKDIQTSKLWTIKYKICAKETPLTSDERKSLQIINNRLEDLANIHQVKIPPLTPVQEAVLMEEVSNVLAEIRGGGESMECEI